MANKEIKNIGFVFSGGLSRGAIQLAFAREIIEKVGYDRIKVISASSIGAINAYSAAAHSTDKMIDCYSKIDAENTKRFIRNIRNDLFGSIFKKIENDDLAFPVYVSGTKIFDFDCQYFCLNSMPRQDRKTAVNVSMAFPIINGPLKFNGGLYIDGGATDNVPTYPLSFYDLDMIIILHCYPKYYPPSDIYELNPGAIVIDVDCTLALEKTVTSFSLARDDFKGMIETGQAEGKIFADRIFKDFNYSDVKNRCLEYTNEKMHARFIKSGDGLMSFVDVINALYVIKED